MDADTVNYEIGMPVWIFKPGRKLKIGTVTGHHPKSGKPLVKWPGIKEARPVSKVFLSLYKE